MRNNPEAHYSSHIIISEIRVGRKLLIAFSFALLLIVLTGSNTSNSFSLALLDSVYTSVHGRAHVRRKLFVCVSVAICTQLSL